MLNRQYGIAAASSIVKVAHPEDSQPNERMQGRNRNLPPKLGTVRPPRFSRIATNSSRPGTQLASRGTWKPRLPTRSRRESFFSSNAGGSGYQNATLIAPEAPTSGSSTGRPATHPAQLGTTSTWVARYKSISPKLPPEPIRRRTPLDASRHKAQQADTPPPRPHSPIPLPGRKRKPKEAPPSEPPPSQKLKVEYPKTLQPDIKEEPSSPASIRASRRLVKEACSFWPTPDNCRKSHSGYSENRKEFAKAKNKELVRLGLKKTRVFFREDGLVIEWRSEVAVWNDTLLPSQSATSLKTYPSGLSPDDSNSEVLKRKRDVIEIVDVDALPTETPPPKRPRPSDFGPAIGSDQKSPGSEQRKPSPRKGKVPIKHWSVGLSMEDVRKLGRSVEAASLKPRPPPMVPPNSCDTRASVIASVTPVSSPSKRLALPTRLTPSERKVISARHSTTASSSPERDKEVRLALDTAPSALRLGQLATPYSNSSQETVSKPPFNSDVDVFFPPVLEETVAPPETEEVLNAQIDTPASNVGASLSLSRGDEAQHLDSIFGYDEVGTQISGSPHMDPQVDRKSENLKHDEAALFEAESQEIEMLCTEDNSVDLPEYEMAEDFLRQFISFFDADRNELKMAYSNDSLLSCRVPSTEPVTPSISTLHIGRTEIIDKLNSLVGYHFSPVGVPSNAIDYDIAVLSQEVINFGIKDGNSIDKGVVGGVLATLHSRINCSDSGLNRTMTLHQSFVLRRRTELDDSGLDGSTRWPLIVISHHMVLRDELLLLTDQPSQLSTQHGSTLA